MYEILSIISETEALDRINNKNAPKTIAAPINAVALSLVDKFIPISLFRHTTRSIARQMYSRIKYGLHIIAIPDKAPRNSIKTIEFLFELPALYKMRSVIKRHKVQIE